MTDIIGPSAATAGAVTVRPTDSRIFGPDDSWFKDCTSADAADGTDLPAAWFNDITAKLRVAVRGMGISESTAPDNMLRDAIRAGMLRLAFSSGTADNLVVAFSPPFTSFGQVSFIVTSPHENTGATMTVTVDGLASKALKYRDGVVPAGTFGPGRYVLVTYDGTAFQVVAGGASGDLPRLRVVTSTGPWVPTSGARAVLVIGQGSGGAGAGATITGTNAFGDGGGAGEVGIHLLPIADVSPSTLITIAAGGVGVSNADGPDGAGDTSFGAHMVLKPGKGGRRNGTSDPTGSMGGTGGSGGAIRIKGNPGAKAAGYAPGEGGAGLLGGGGEAGSISNDHPQGGDGVMGSGGGSSDRQVLPGGNGGAGFFLTLEF